MSGRGNGPSAPVVVALLVAINLAVFALELRMPDAQALIDAFSLIPYDLASGIVLPPPSPPLPALTLVTSLFFHASALHVGVNVLVLAAFGPAIEAACGHLRFAALYLACGLAGGLLQFAVAPHSHVPTIGASGAIAGVLGAFAVRYPGARLPLVPVPALAVIGLWVAAQFVHGFGAVTPGVGEGDGGVAYFAHIGGFFCGAVSIDRLVRAGTRTYRPY